MTALEPIAPGGDSVKAWMSMTKPHRFLGLLLLLAAIGCSNEEAGPAGTPITCEWFAGDNCWKTAVAEAEVCVQSGATGSMSSDWLTCSYSTGTEIAFATSPAKAMDDNYQWDFDIATNGVSCVSYSDFGNGNGFSLKTASGEVREEITGTQLVLTCPNGGKYSIGGLDALSCLMSGLPGSSWSSSTSYVSFSFLGAASPRELFNCASTQP